MAGRAPITVAVVFGILGIGWLLTDQPSAPPQVSAAAAASSPRALFADQPAAVPANALPTPPKPPVTVEIVGESAAVIAEQVELQRLGAEMQVELTPEQWATLAAVTAHHQAVRGAFEASMAELSTVAPGRYQIKIPAYVDAGAALRAQLFADLANRLGAAVAAQVEAQLGDVLNRHFAGFGAGLQTLEFLADGAAASIDYQVTRTAHFWTNVGGEDRLITRQQRHFPAIEDPSGHFWGPYLSVVERELAGRS